MGMGFPEEYRKPTVEETMQYDRRYHGAREVILFNGRDIDATFRIYDDGIRVGCTFIDKKAIGYIVAHLKAEGLV